MTLARTLIPHARATEISVGLRTSQPLHNTGSGPSHAGPQLRQALSRAGRSGLVQADIEAVARAPLARPTPTQASTLSGGGVAVASYVGGYCRE